MTAAQLEELVKSFGRRLAAARKSTGNRDFPWYPYDSLANVLNLQKAFGDRYLPVLDSAAGKIIADIGCGDGDLAFFLESLGCAVDAIDFPESNHNEMRGIRALKRHLDSHIEIAEADLDSQFKLPRRQYDLAVFLGILYHLKNPLYVMERLAMHSRYCLLSTRVARYFPDDKPMPQGQPIAYLLGQDELNADPSNFWIFSHTCLKRLFERSFWKILDYASVGDTSLSTPIDPHRDERVFCLLESHYGLANIELLSGWHQPEVGGSRWTEQRFSARINLATRAGPDRVLMCVYVPQTLLTRLGPRRLEIQLGAEPAEPAILDRPGYHDVVRRFRSHGSRSLVVSFQLDGALPPDESDNRERGIVVASLDCE